MPPTLAQYLSDALASLFLISGSDFLPMMDANHLVWIICELVAYNDRSIPR
jgi:hypothetical protein